MSWALAVALRARAVNRGGWSWDYLVMFLGMLLAIQAIRPVPSLAAALMGDPCARRWPDFFDAPSCIFCSSVWAATPAAVATFSIDGACHGVGPSSVAMRRSLS